MTIQVKKNWWKTLFDDLYLKTDARSVCDQDLTRREVDYLIDTLGLDPGDPVLDLCGGHGRHTLEFSRRGFKRITLFDYSACLLAHGLHEADRKGLAATFIQGDARRPGLKENTFLAILIMGCSFGYFSDDAENSQILKSAYRLLRSGGHLLLDLPNRDYVVNHFTPEIHHQAGDDLIIKRTREIRGETIYAREEVVSKTEGCLRVNHYCTRLYDGDGITALLAGNDFDNIKVEYGFMDRSDSGNYGSMTNRMIVRATKP